MKFDFQGDRQRCYYFQDNGTSGVRNKKGDRRYMQGLNRSPDSTWV